MAMNANAEPTHILWTSGWDSTFRVCDLLLNHHRLVQPWYVMKESRRSMKRELATMARIRSALVSKDPAVAELLRPVEIRRIEDIPADPAVTARQQQLAARSTLGPQYDWLSRLANTEQVTLELCIHRDDKAHGVLGDDVVVGADGAYRVDPAAHDPALKNFESFTFPVFDLTKVDMQERAERDGFVDIMELTWFCHKPLLDGKPCGFCKPCQYTRDEGLGRRVPPATRRRRLHYLGVEAAWRMWSKGRGLTR